MSSTITRTNELIAKLNKDSAPQEPAPRGEATARPWTLGADASIYDANGDCVADSFTLWRDDADDRKTAELIVTRVNAYDTLAARVERLEKALRDVGVEVIGKRVTNKLCFCRHAGIRCAKQPQCVAANATLGESK